MATAVMEAAYSPSARESDDDEWTDESITSSEEEEPIEDEEEDEEEEEEAAAEEDPDAKVEVLLREEMGMEPEETLEDTLNAAREYMGTEVQEEDPRAEMYMVAFDLGIIVRPHPQDYPPAPVADWPAHCGTG